MRLVVTIYEGEDVYKADTDLDKYPAMTPILRLLAILLKCNLAEAFAAAGTAGLNVLLQEYHGVELQGRIDELRRRLRLS